MDKFKYKYHDLFNPILNALHELGGSASVSEIEDFVIDGKFLIDWATAGLKLFHQISNIALLGAVLNLAGQAFIGVAGASLVENDHVTALSDWRKPLCHPAEVS